jgi:hypothetical protein
MDDNFAKDDEALDYIVYREITKNTSHRPEPAREGCLSVLLLPVLFIAGVYLLMT